MSFFDDASLAFLPSGGAGKDTKAYSIKPTDGSGDFTFSRGSNLAATRVGPTGLIEKGRENLLTYSNQFNTTWFNTSSSVTGGQTGYDGSSDAWLLSALSSYPRIGKSISSSGVNTYSVYAKANTSDFLVLRGSFGGSQYAIVDLSDGTFPLLYSTFISGSATSVGNGWFRVSLSFTGSLTEVAIGVSTDGTLAGWANTTNESLFIQDAQLEIGLAATDYIESGATTGKAGLLEDEPRFDYSGGATCPSLLLEPSRTNLIPQSEYFGDTQWSVDGVSLDANNTTSPEGLQNAYKITDDTSTGYHKITKTNVFAADGTMRTWSVFVKKETARYCIISHAEIFSSYVNSLIFDMESGVYTNQGTTDYFDVVHDPIDMGNGWWRIGFSSDINSSSYDNFSIGISRGADWLNNASYTGDGSLDFYAYGAQLEVGSYPTSYIPNHSGGSVTRGADYSESSTSLSIGDSEFCAYYEIDAEVIPRESSNTFFRIEFNSGSDFIGIKGSSDSVNNMYTLQTFGGYSETIGNVTEAGVVKFLINYSSGTGDLFVNGTKYAGVITGPTTGNTIDNIELRGSGYSHDSKQILIFPEALSDADCITLTTL